MKFSILSIFLWLVFVSLFGQSRLTTSFNSHWSFNKSDIVLASQESYDDSSWNIVSLPHTWNDKDVLPDGDRGYYRGVGWYRKHISIPDNKLSKRFYLHFEGAGQLLKLYVNGELVGSHIGGYSAFTFDITKFLREGDNVLAIRLDNTPNSDIAPLSADFTFFGGIYRDVFLIETDPVHFEMLDYGSSGIYIQTPKVSQNSSSVKVKGTVRNDSDTNKKIDVKVSVYDGSHVRVAQIQKKLKIAAQDQSVFELSKSDLQNIHLWSPKSPNLYTAEVQVLDNGKVLDEVIEKFGFRWFHFDAKEGFFLNGKPLKLMGANRHQDYWGLGNALSDDLHRSDLQLLKQMGGNFIRLAHYPQDPAVLGAADELGLLVWEETPLVNEVTLSQQHDDNAEVMLKEMIRQHYNHPSVILWGYMNEIYWAHRFLSDTIVDKHTEATVALAKRLEKVAREEDPDRYTAMALHNYPLYEESGLDEIPMVVGWNLYHGWYYDTYEGFGRFMDDQHKKYPDRIHFISDYGAGSDPRLHSTLPERFDFTMEGQKRFLESFLKQIMDRPYISGGAVWNLIDFSSERRIDTNPHLNNKGLATADRVPKDPFFLYQAALADAPFIKIAETNWTERSGSPEGDKATVMQPVQVYTNFDQVELIMNGKSLGAKLVVDHAVTWIVPFSNGVHHFTAKGSGAFDIEDHLTINFKLVPHELINEKGRIDIPINAGCNYSFYDNHGKVTWLPDKAYSPGSWGYIGGEPLYVSNKIGTKEDILTTTYLEPLYQSIRMGSEGYQFDVPDGWYELELLMVENYPKSRRFVEGKESPKHPGGLRKMEIIINDKIVVENLDLLKTYGYNYPYRTKIKMKAENEKGVKMVLKAIKGKTTVSAVRLRSL